MTPQELKKSILSKAFTGGFIESAGTDIEQKNIPQGYEDDLFDIPSHWDWSSLGECCEMYTGNSISESVKKAKYLGLEEGYPYIGTKDVSFEQSIDYDNGVRIPFDEGFKIAYEDSILMCVEGGSAGRKIGILDRDVCFGNKLCMFKPYEFEPKYVYYYLQSMEFRTFFLSQMTGSIGGVSIKKLKSIPIPETTLEEQKRIVAKIEELLPYIDKYEKAWTKLEEFNKKFPDDMQKSILQMAIQGKLVEQRAEEGTAEELYQQIQEEKQKLIKEKKIKKQKALPEITEDEIPFDIPDSWKWVRFNDVIDVRDGTHDSPKYHSEGVPLITSKNISSGYLDFNNVKYISKQDAEKINERSVVNNGDILFAMIGSIGNPVVVNKNREFCVKNVALFKMYSNNINITKYLYYYLCFAQHQLKKEASGGVQSFISLKRFREYLLPLPPLHEQQRIVKKIELLLPMCGNLKEI